MAAVGITNQRETAVAWDRGTGRALAPAIVWQDRRTADHCDRLADAGYLPLVRDRTGLVLDPYFSATKYAWLLADGGVAAGSGQAAGGGVDLALGTVDSWVLWNLTGGPSGGVFATDPTNASRTLLYDIGRREWSDELCALFDVPRRALADVRPSCGRLGTVDTDAVGGPSTDVARQLGGVPVSGVAGDQQAALFGQACFEPGMAKVTYGTGSFVLVNAGPTRPTTPDGLLVTVAWDLGQHGGDAGPVAYALEGSTFVSGAAVQWLRDGLGLIERADELGPLAESVADSGGVVVVPAFTGLGSPWWDPRARGIVTGLTRGAGRPQVARATVEAMAFQVRDMLSAMTRRPVSHSASSGPTVARRRWTSCSSCRPTSSASRSSGRGSSSSTALGAATLAGLAEGVWGSLDDLAAQWQPDIEKGPEVDEVWVDLAYTAWQRAVERSRGWAD